MIVMTAAVLIFSLTLCAASSMLVERSVDRASMLLMAAQRAARMGDIPTARTRMLELESGWRDDGCWLELLIAHDALSDVRGDISDALLCLEMGDRAEFLRASAGVSANLERLRMTEAVRFINLF